MGKRADTAEQRSPVERPVASTVPVAFTAFLALLVQSLILVPNGSIEGIQRIVSIIWALVSFGGIVNQLASALQSDQDKLQKSTDPIPPLIPPDASEGCLPNVQCFSLLDEGYISQAEQHFDQVSQSATSIVFSWKAPNLPSGMAETAASKPSQALLPGPSYSSNFLARTHLHSRGRQIAQAVVQACSAFPQSPIELQLSRPHTPRARSRHSAVAEARSFSTRAGDTKAALMDTPHNSALLLFHRDDAT